MFALIVLFFWIELLRVILVANNLVVDLTLRPLLTRIVRRLNLVCALWSILNPMRHFLSNPNAIVIVDVINCGVVLTDFVIGDLYELLAVPYFSFIQVSVIGRFIFEVFIRLRKYLRVLLQLRRRTRFSLIWWLFLFAAQSFRREIILDYELVIQLILRLHILLMTWIAVERHLRVAVLLAMFVFIHPLGLGRNQLRLLLLNKLLAISLLVMEGGCLLSQLWGPLGLKWIEPDMLCIGHSVVEMILIASYFLHYYRVLGFRV